MKKKELKEVYPRFCTKCGQDLRMDARSTGYNAFTGKQEFAYFYICPTVKSYGYLGDGVVISESGTHDVIYLNEK